MAASFRFCLLVSLCFVASFAAGWICRPVAKPAVAMAATTPAKVITPENIREIVSSVHPAIVSPDERAKLEGIRIRRETVAQYKRNGGNYFLGYGQFFNANFDYNLAFILGLTPGEIDQLNAALARTKRDLDDLALRNATAQTSADGKTLIVTVPSAPTESSRIYDELLAALSNVLGPERLQLFKEISGDGFDHSFDQFGLNPVRYELTLQPTTFPDGTQVYPYASAFLVAGATTGSISGSEQSFLRADGIKKSHPVLAHFLPPDFGKPAGK